MRVRRNKLTVHEKGIKIDIIHMKIFWASQLFKRH